MQALGLLEGGSRTKRSCLRAGMGKGVPARKRLTHVKRRGGLLSSELNLDDAATTAEPVSAPNRPWNGSGGLEQIAMLLWLPCYERLFQMEFQVNEEECGAGYVLTPTSYRQRLKGEPMQAYDARRRQQRRDEMAIALHANNQQRWSPSILARSVSYFCSASGWINANESRQRRVASAPTTWSFLRRMRDCQPKPEYELGPHVFFYAADQTYEWVGMKKRGARKTIERLDGHGMPVVINHEVYINSINLHLPASLGTLSAADLLTIANNHGSPYTEDYNCVFAPLDPTVVQGSLLGFAREAIGFVVAKAQAEGVGGVEGLSLRAIATALYGRPNIATGSSDFDILEPLPRTDTKSYDDFIKITAHLSAHSGPHGVVDIFCGDGQSVISFKNLKKRFTSRYARWLIAVGGFHEHAHTLFAFTEMWYLCFFCSCLSVLCIERVLEVTQDLEHNAYAHHQRAHAIVTIAIVSFLVQDVQWPPPSLLVRSIDSYLLQVHTAGGTVMVQYLKHAGIPALHWLHAARTGDGGKLKKLFAYSFHIFRSTCHKPICTQIALIAMLGFCCALPALQAVLLATVSLSLLRHNIYVDRLLEMINKIQQGTKRSSNAASFGRAMDMTSLLRAILHVRHAFQAEEQGATESDDAITTDMLVQARVLQNHFLEVLGRDLSVLDPNNPFWHTGNAVPLDTGDFRQRRPEVYLWRVAAETSTGKGRSDPEKWDKFVRRFVFDHFFQY